MKRRSNASLSLAVAAAAALAGCATVELDPPARAVAGGGAGPGATAAHPVLLQVSEAALSFDMLVDDANEASRIVVFVDVENRDAIANEIDLGGARLIVRAADGHNRIQPPIGSGWGALPASDPVTRALPAKLAPGERRRGWLVFEAPPRPAEGGAAEISLFVAVERERPELVLAAPEGGPRWLRPTTGPMRVALSNAFFAGPSFIGDAVVLRTMVSAGRAAVQFGGGPLVARHHGHAEIGGAATVEVDLPSRLRLSPWLLATPFLGLEFAFSSPSFPNRYPRQQIALAGLTAGIELGFGRLRPPNADRLPLDYRHPLAPFALRIAYVHWWGAIDDDFIPAAGRSGLLASVTATFGP